MLRLLAGLGLASMFLLLSGCYVAPGYSYVRQAGYQGDAYYGQSRVYDDGYYPAPGYAPYYGGGYGYGCCYAPGVSVGVGAVWYGGRSVRRGRYEQPQYRRYDGRQDHRGGWRSSPDRGDARPRHTDGRRASEGGRSRDN